MSDQFDPPPRAPEDSTRRRLLQLVALGSAIALAVAAIEISRRGRRAESTQVTAAYMNGAAPGGAMPQRWLPPVPTASDEPVTFDQIMGRIKEFESNPEAAQFAQAAMKEPALKEIVAQFRDRRRAAAPGGASEFFRAVTGRLEFRQLAGKFMASPGAAALLARLSAASGMGDAMRNLAMLVAMSPGSGAAGLAAARSESPGTRAQVVNTGGAGAAAPVGSASRLNADAAQAGGAAGLGAAPRLAPLQEAQGPGPEAERAQMAPPPQERKDSQSVVNLNKTHEEANSETMDQVLKDWLARYGLDPAVYLGSLGQGLWDQCFQRHELAKCDKACNNQPKMISTDKHDICAKPVTPKPDLPYWDACLQAGFGELDCILECHNQSPPCDWDPDAVDRLCTPTPPDTCAPQCVSAGACQNQPPGATAATPTGTGTTPTNPAGTQGGSYTIKSGDNMTRIVMAVYHITDPNVAYRTALELYDYGKNRAASSYNGRNPYDPNLIYPGKVLTLPPLPTLKGMTIG